MAFDTAFKDAKGHASWDSKLFIKVAPIAEKMGFTWGGRWKNKDRVHFQWDKPWPGAKSRPKSTKTPVEPEIKPKSPLSSEAPPPLLETATLKEEPKGVINLPTKVDLLLIWDKFDDLLLEAGRLFLIGGGLSAIALLSDKVANLPIDPPLTTVLTFLL